MNAEVNDADLIAQRVLDTETELTTDEVLTLAQAYQRVVRQRDEWQSKHDALASRQSLRDAVEHLDS